MRPEYEERVQDALITGRARLDRAAEAARQIAELEVTVHSRGREVTVTVSSTGRIKDVGADPNALRGVTYTKLAELYTRTIADAQDTMEREIRKRLEQAGAPQPEPQPARADQFSGGGGRHRAAGGNA